MMMKKSTTTELLKRKRPNRRSTVDTMKMTADMSLIGSFICFNWVIGVYSENVLCVRIL